ncbi:MAG: dual specificity protein phosphatase family protein [Elusimicrobia bacterium]|nr:dual specificity protein phosphatase family protein [Elusimicrobiota bacterium]
MKRELRAYLAGALLLAAFPAHAAPALDSSAIAGKAAAILGEFAPGMALPEAAAAPVADVAAAKAPAAQPLPNFGQVSPTLYRSGQPSQAGVAKIKSAGVKTILKLNVDDPAESDWAANNGLDLETVLMSNKVSPTYDQIDQALAIINDTSKQPVLVHCHLGHDRTGAVVGAYRITVQGWSVDKAAAEAKAMGYSNPNYDDITAYLQGYLAHVRRPL